MPAEAAFQLKTRALNHDERFKQMGIVSLKLDGDTKYVNTSTGALTASATTSPLAALWSKIPALFASVVGIPIGQLLTILVGAVFIIGATLTVSLLGPGGAAQPPTDTPMAISPPTHTPTPTTIATSTATASQTPTGTATLTPTASPTSSPTATETFTPTPAFSILSAEVINRTACRHGPGDIYLYRFGLIPTNRMEVRGQMNLWNGKEFQTWVWGLPEFFPGECWVNARDVRLDGELASLEVLYPDKVDLPFVRDSRWPVPQNVEVERLGDEVTVSWDFFDVPLGERESENSPRYILEAWLCQDGQLIFTPIPVYRFTRVSVIDQAGCAEPSHGRIILSEKHGYVGPVEIKWLPVPPP
jgi:hypothetical protein